MFRRITALFVISLLVLVGACQASSVEYTRLKTGRLTAHIIAIDLNNQGTRVTVALAKGGTGKHEPFKGMVKRVKPAAAITGTFFDTRTFIPTGDIAVYGTLVHVGVIGSALCIDRNNKPCVVSLKEGRKQGWMDYETVLCAGPRLVKNGAVSIALKKEGFRSSLTAPTRRTAVGITGKGKILLLVINCSASLHDTARALLAAGAREGLCLDGGSSTGLYYNGSFLAVPNRQLTNLIVVYREQKQYQSVKKDIAPAKYFAQLSAGGVPASRRGLLSPPILHFSAILPAVIDNTPAIRSLH